MAGIIPFPDKQYAVIYADPPWAYQQQGGKNGKRGTANAHYNTMTTADICELPIRAICAPGGGGLLYVGNVSEHRGGHQGHGGVGVQV